MLFALLFRITKATNTYSEYVIIVAFPRQQRLLENATMLRYMHIACLVRISVIYLSVSNPV